MSTSKSNDASAPGSQPPLAEHANGDRSDSYFPPQPTAEERYRAFIQNSTEGIWRAEAEEPVPINLPEDEQIDAYYRVCYLAEANDAFAQMYGFETADELIGARLGDLLIRDDPANEEYLRAFIRAGYHLADAESVETDRDGNIRHFSNTLTGVIENGHIVRAWGTQRDITERQRWQAERDALLAERTRVAEMLQRSLLLTPAPRAFAGLEIETYYESASDEALLGGDWFEVFPLGGNRYCLAVGDNTGKGIESSIYTAELKFALKALAREAARGGGEVDPAYLLSRLNAHVQEGRSLDGKPSDAFVSLTIAILDVDTGNMGVAAAGMEPPLIVRAATGDTEEIPAGGPILGTVPAWNDVTIRAQLGEKDVLLLFTDGLTEARQAARRGQPHGKRRFFGYEGVSEAAAEALRASGNLDTAGARIVAAAKEFAGSGQGGLADDLCLLLVRRQTSDPRLKRLSPPGITSTVMRSSNSRDADATARSLEPPLPPVLQTTEPTNLPLPDDTPPVASLNRRLQPLTSALLEAVTPAEVATVVVERGMSVLGAQAGVIALVSPDGRDLEIVESRGFQPAVMDAWHRFPLAPSDAPLPLSDAVREVTPLFFTGATDWKARYPDLVRQLMRPVHASVSLPLTARGRAFGGMHFSFPEEREFAEADRAFLDELARQCSLALDRALLQEETQRAREMAEAAQRRQRYLAEASAVLGSSLDYERTLDSIAHLAVPTLADWCTVHILGESGIERIAVAHVDPDKVAWGRTFHETYPTRLDAPGGLGRVLTTGQSEAYFEITDAMLEAAARDPEHLAIIRAVGFVSVIYAPLVTRGRVLGALTFVTTQESGRRFTEADLAMAEDLGRRAAAAVDNARLYAEAQREVVERREAEWRAEQAVAHLRLVTDAAPLLISYVDRDQRYRFVNHGYADWFGMPQEQIVGRSVAEVIGEAAFAKTRAQVKAALSGQRVSFENMLPYGDGEHPRYVHVDMVPDRGEDGTVRGYVAVVSDITERHRAEERIAESEQRFRSLFEQNTDAVYEFDLTGRFVSANAACEHISGYTTEELLQMTFVPLLVPEDRERTIQRFQRAIQGEPQSYELAIHHKSGRRVELAITKFPVVVGGRIVGIYGIARDITERKVAQDALRVSENRLRLALAAARQRTWEVDLVAGAVHISGELGAPDGSSEAETHVFPDLNDYNAVYEGDREALRSAFEAAVRGETPTFECQYRSYRPEDGALRWYATSGSVLRDPVTDTALKVVGVVRDITYEKELEAERAAAAVRQRRFLREMLFGLTEGKFYLCDTEDDLPAPLAPVNPPTPLSAPALRLLRKEVEVIADEMQFDKERTHDLETAVGEAAMNAVTHGGGARVGSVHADTAAGTIQVRVRDEGTGIAEHLIHRAIEQGWTTGGFGQGLFLMWRTCDRIYLLTGATGTTVVLEMDRQPPPPSWLAIPR